MLFNSIHFLVFFPIVVGLYYSIPHRFRWVLLLIIIFLSTLIDYFVARRLYDTKSQKIKNYLLGVSLVFNLGTLFAFKYFNFFSDSTREIFQHLSIQLDPITLQVLLPVGISFYTFQTLSYTIDVYRNNIKPEKHFGIFALYVSFFPQLVAGPIERAKNLLPQFYEKHEFNYDRVTFGLKLMLWGFFKKVVIADRLAVVVDTVFGNVYEHTGTAFILATFFYAFQIYCDFSGYSDIAIGSAHVMGFRLMTNFRRPYFSKSIPEFWRRWHISLSTWFKDYVFIPLGGRMVTIPRLYFNLTVVFVVSGLWHGANWTFVAWGLLNAVYMILDTSIQLFRERFFKPIKSENESPVISIFKILLTFVLVNIGWIFFRANNVSEALYIVSNLFSKISFTIPSLNMGLTYFGLVYILMLIGFLMFVEFIQERTSIKKLLETFPVAIRWSGYIVLLLIITTFGVFNHTQFIYFQF